jgi:predicted nucleic acid-binding protein
MRTDCRWSGDNCYAIGIHIDRAAGTIRRTLDCLIAAVCVRESSAILHNDGDFDHLAAVTELIIHRATRLEADR